MDHESGLLSSAEVATLLGISARTVCLWAELAELPGFKVGRRWRFQPDVIRTWLSRAQAGLDTRQLAASPARFAAVAASAAYSLGRKGV